MQADYVIVDAGSAGCVLAHPKGAKIKDIVEKVSQHELSSFSTISKRSASLLSAPIR
jgi:hypothetical protein